MSRWLTLRSWFQSVVLRSRIDREIDDELRFHVEEQTQAGVQAGMTPADARRAAYGSLGGPPVLVREACRDLRAIPFVDSFIGDLRYAVRSLRTHLSFTAVLVTTVALGIGSSTTVFSVANAVLLRPLPYRDSDRLVAIWGVESRNALKQRASYPDFLDWKAESRTLDMVGYGGIDAILTGHGEPQKLQAELTTGNLFTLLGAAPALGTTVEAEGKDRQEPLVVLSHGLWLRTFNADPDVLGRHIVLNGLNHTVTAVMPPGFQFPTQPMNPVDLWVPLERFNPALKGQRNARLIEVIGRLKSHVTLDQAQAEMDVIASRLGTQYPDTNTGLGVRLVPVLEDVTGDVSRGLRLLLAAVGSLMLIACLNVANLLLARTVGRRQEIATRSALGAGRLRIGRQLLIESVLVASLGGFLGGVLVMWAVQALGRVLPEGLPRAHEITVNGRVLVFAVGMSLTTGLLFGLAPAWHAWHVDLSGSLQDNARAVSQSATSRRLSNVLIVSEIAVALILLTGAGLLVHSFAKLNQSASGFDPRNVLTFEVSWPSGRHPQPVQSFQELRTRLLQIPGVVAASTGLQLPDRGNAMLRDISPFVEVEGRPTPLDERRRTAILPIQPGYFAVMGIPLVEGRDFEERDLTGRVTIINESLARAYFPHHDAIGKHLTLDSWVLPSDRTQEIIGVAGDVKHRGLKAGVAPLVYLPLGRRPTWSQYVVVKTKIDPLLFVKPVQEALHAFDPDQPLHDVQTLEQRVSHSLARDRFSAQVLGLFALLALTITAVGVSGVLSYVTAQRTQEIGIRMALGAQASDVVKGIMGHGIKLIVTGVLLGLAGAVAAAQVITSVLFDTPAADPVALVGATTVLVFVALSACWVPARVAAQIDPVVALRH